MRSRIFKILTFSLVMPAVIVAADDRSRSKEFCREQIRALVNAKENSKTPLDYYEAYKKNSKEIEEKVSALSNQELRQQIQKWMDETNKSNGYLPGLDPDTNFTTVQGLLDRVKHDRDAGTSLPGKNKLTKIYGNLPATSTSMELEDREAIQSLSAKSLETFFKLWADSALSSRLLQELDKRFKAGKIE